MSQLVSSQDEESILISKTALDPEEASEKLMDKFEFRTFSDTEEILCYQDGIYVPGGESLIKGWMELHADRCDKRLVNETLGHVQRLTLCSRAEFDRDPTVLNLQNGLFDLKTFAHKPHSTLTLCLVQFPVKFDRAADCPAIRKFLGEVLYSEDILVVQEFVGYCLWKGYPSSKALLLVGDGENGKSTFINLIKALLGKENICSRGLQELELNRFAKADLYAKLANLFADLPDTALKSTGTFKMLTGGDPITAEHKFTKSFNFTNYAKLIFSANKVPETFEDTTAYFRRWLIVVFPNQFAGEGADKDLLGKLTTEAELSGFLNWALEGLKRLKINGWNFSNSKSTAEVREDYIRRSSPVQAFLMDCTQIKTDCFLAKKELYGAFVEYCKARKLPLIIDTTFFRKLPMFASVNESRPVIDGRRVHGYTGLALNVQGTGGE